MPCLLISSLLVRICWKVRARGHRARLQNVALSTHNSGRYTIDAVRWRRAATLERWNTNFHPK
jgi:hypothetical protein